MEAFSFHVGRRQKATWVNCRNHLDLVDTLAKKHLRGCLYKKAQAVSFSVSGPRLWPDSCSYFTKVLKTNICINMLFLGHELWVQTKNGSTALLGELTMTLLKNEAKVWSGHAWLAWFTVDKVETYTVHVFISVAHQGHRSVPKGKKTTILNANNKMHLTI